MFFLVFGVMVRLSSLSYSSSCLLLFGHGGWAQDWFICFLRIRGRGMRFLYYLAKAEGLSEHRFQGIAHSQYAVTVS